MRMGQRLAQKMLEIWPEQDIDVVIPIPDTSRTAALEMAHILGCKYREGFIKNRYIGRTFIMPGQTERKKSVRQKLNPINLEYKNKNVLLVYKENSNLLPFCLSFYVILCNLHVYHGLYSA